MKLNRNEKSMLIGIILLVSMGIGLLSFGIKSTIHSSHIQTQAYYDADTPMLTAHPSTVDISTPDDTEFRTEKTDPMLPNTWWVYTNTSEYKTEDPMQRGSRYNLLTPTGNFRIEPFSIPSSIANDRDQIMAQSRKIYRESYYENAWRGEPMYVNDAHYEIVVSRPSEWTAKYLGIAWCSFYATQENVELELGGKWNPVITDTNQNNAYMGWRSSTDSQNIAMPFVTRPLLRTYHYNVYASDDYFHWSEVAVAQRSHQNTRTYAHDPIRDPTDDWDVNPTRTQDDTGWNTGYYARDPDQWSASNVYPYNGLMRPTGEWQDPTWNDIEYVQIPDWAAHYKYFKIEIAAITLTDNIGMFTGSTSNPLVAPEIGEIVFNYTIEDITSCGDCYDAEINSPMENAWYQVAPYDSIPLEIGTRGLTVNPSEDPSIESVSFYIDNAENNKVLVYSHSSESVSPPNISISSSDFTNVKNIWNTSDNAYYASNPYLYPMLYEKAGVTPRTPKLTFDVYTTEPKWSAVYDVGVILKDYGATDMYRAVIKQFEGNDTFTKYEGVTYGVVTRADPNIPYPSDYVKDVDGDHAVVLDHFLSYTQSIPNSPFTYNYRYETVKYMLGEPTGLDYQWMRDSNPINLNDTFAVTPNYGLSLAFDYGYIGNPIEGTYENEYSASWHNFTAPTYGDNYLFLSFTFRPNNYYRNGSAYTVYLLVSGNPSDSDGLIQENRYKEFIDKIESEGAIYIPNFTKDPSSERETFQIKNFAALCDYVVDVYNLDVFGSASDYLHWASYHGYVISNITFTSVLNTHRYKLLAEGDGDFASQYSVDDFRPPDRSVSRYYIDQYEPDKWRLYGEVENIETMNDSIYLDNIEVDNVPVAENSFVNVYASIPSEKFFGYGPKEIDSYTMNNEKNPRSWLLRSSDRDTNVSENYNNLLNFYGKSLLINMGAVVLAPQSHYTVEVGVSSSYGYGSISDDPLDRAMRFQTASVTIAGIVLIPHSVSSDLNGLAYASYNDYDPLIGDGKLPDDGLGKAVIIRNAFADAVVSGYEKDKRIESVISTSIYSDSPSIGDYVEVTLNFPVSGYYDLYLRDSLVMHQEVDHNRYTVSIDGNLYRRYAQDYDGLLGYDEYQYYQSHVSSVSDSYQEEEDLGDRLKLLHVASDFFTAGSHTFRISFDGFEDYSYYNVTLQKIITTRDDFSRIRYDQIVMYYRSSSSYRIPVSYFQKILPYSNVHSISVEINLTDTYAALMGNKTLKFTTHFGIETKPVINFEFGAMDDYIAEVYGGDRNGDSDKLHQMQYITNLNGEYTLSAYIMGNNINTNSLRYRINDGEWRSWDSIEDKFGIFKKVTATIEMSQSDIRLGKNIIEVEAKSSTDSLSQAYLVFYYDPNAPDISVISSSVESGGSVSGYDNVNFTLHVSDAEGIINRVSYSTGLKSTWDRYTRSYYTSYTAAKIPVFDRILNRRETNDVIINVSIPISEIEQGNSTIQFIAEDIAGNVKTIDFRIRKVSTFMIANFTKPDWRYVDSDVPVFINATNYVLEGGDSRYIVPSYRESETKWIQFGYGDKNERGYVYSKIETEFIAQSPSITKIGIVLQSPIPNLKDFPAMIEVKDERDVTISRGYVFPSSKSIYSMGGKMRYVDLPDAILEVGKRYKIVLTPISAPYNIMNVKIASYSNDPDKREWQMKTYGQSFGYYKGIRMPLNGYVISIMFGKKPVPLQQAGDAYYSHNGGQYIGPFSDGVINITIPKSEQLQGWNNITIKIDNGGGLFYYYYRSYRWLDKNYHSPPHAIFISPTAGSNQRGNISIRIKYDYPEYNETYRIKLFIRKANDQWQWFRDLVINETTETDEIEITLNTNTTIDGRAWLNDSADYEIMAYIDDGYDIYRAYSGYFAINNYGPNPLIISPVTESRWNYNVIFRANVTTYGDSVISTAWLYFNGDKNNRFEVLPKYFEDMNNSKVYYFEYRLPLNQLQSGPNTIVFHTEDQYGRVGTGSVEIIRDTETYIEIEAVTPSIPNPYEETKITYSVFDDYKRVDIYLSYSDSYGDSGFKKIASITGDNITGEFSLGKLNNGNYNVIVSVEDEAGNVYTAEQSFEVIEAGALNSISERVIGISTMIGGIFSLAVAYKLGRNQISRNPKMCNSKLLSKTKICRV